jgi:Domain of unknown function (DUF4389)
MMCRMAYPISVDIQPALTNRNRLTTAFRIVLAIPHLLLVGGFGFAAATRGSGRGFGGDTGILGGIAWILAVISWFTILLTGTHITGIRQFTLFFVRWRVRALAYLMLLEDRYPPFGDMEYPAAITIAEPSLPRHRLSVAFRLLLVIPHIFVLCFVMFGWCVTTIAAWFLILLTGAYPSGLYEFGAGTLRWYMRVEAYVLLLVDDYPPFSLG